MKKNNNKLYIILSIVSVVCCVASLFFCTEHKAFTMFASIGCSGIVSVLVAWLLERSNERIQSTKDKEILDCLLNGFDVGVKSEMQRALLNCDRVTELDIDKEYTITEISALLKELPANHVYFRGLPDMMEKSMHSLSPTTLLSLSKNENGIKLHSLFSVLQSNINTTHLFIENDGMPDISKGFGIEIITTLDQINKLRGINEKYSIPEDSKKYILAMRKAKQNLKAVE